jgi:restriction endonuclease S subunit
MQRLTKDYKMAECFTVYSDKIKERFDPLYLKNIYLIKNVNTKFPLVTLGELLRDKVQYGANEPAIDGDPETDIRYIRITDIDEFGNLKNDDWKTAPRIDDKYLLEENDILFARSGATAGKGFIYKNEFGKAIFAGYLIRFKIDEEKANPKYVFFYTLLKRYNSWVKLIQRPSGQPNINSEEFKSFEIPLPPREIQNKIVKIMESAYHQKEEKEAEAQKLLDSIHDYVLKELGITLPKLKDKKCYSVNFEEIHDNRLDSYYYEPKFRKIEEEVKKGKYKEVTLKEVAKEILSGQRPKGGVRQISEGVPSLGGEHVLNDGSIATQDLKFIPLEFHQAHLKSKVQKQDIIVVKDGATTGKVGIVPENYPYEDANINEHVFLIRCKKEINPHYLFSILKSTIGQVQIGREVTGGTIMGIIRESIENIKIPLPSLKVQNKIASESKKRISDCAKFRSETNKLIEQTKQDVENLIIGK